MRASSLGTLCWVIATTLFQPTNCVIPIVQDTPENWENPSYVYRGDGRGPEAIEADDGLRPRKPVPAHDTAYSLQNHAEHWHKVQAQIRDYDQKMKDFEAGKGEKPQGNRPVFDSRYVSTSASYSQTFDYIKSKETPGTIYMIKTTPNAIDMNKSYRLKGKSLGLEHGMANAYDREFAFLEGIGFKQIKAWKKPGDETWTMNPKYDTRFDKFTHGGAHPELFDSNSPGLRNAAKAILNSPEMITAKLYGAAPSDCSANGARRAKRQAACRYGNSNDAEYDTRWGPSRRRRSDGTWRPAVAGDDEDEGPGRMPIRPSRADDDDDDGPGPKKTTRVRPSTGSDDDDDDGPGSRKTTHVRPSMGSDDNDDDGPGPRKTTHVRPSMGSDDDDDDGPGPRKTTHVRPSMGSDDDDDEGPGKKVTRPPGSGRKDDGDSGTRRPNRRPKGSRGH